MNNNDLGAMAVSSGAGFTKGLKSQIFCSAGIHKRSQAKIFLRFGQGAVLKYEVR